jgi:hypothetical protein
MSEVHKKNFVYSAKRLKYFFNHIKEGDLELVEAFWSNEALGLSGPCVPEPLVIADLMASLDPRNLEVAAELKKRWDDGFEG